MESHHRRLATLALSAAGASALAFTPPAFASSPAPIEFVADVPLLEVGGLPCVEAAIGAGGPLVFGIDTGNMNNSVDSNVAKSAGLELLALPPSAPKGVFKTVVPALRIGPLTLDKPHVLVFDFAEYKLPEKIVGMLTYAAFKDRIVQLDFVAHRVRITAVLASSVSIPEPRDHFSYITFGPEGPPIIVARGFEIDGKPVTAQLDTMYTGSLVIYGASIGKLGLAEEAAVKAAEFFPLTDGGVNMKVSPARSESFHGTRLGPADPKVYFPTPGVHEPGGLFDATVGLALFRDTVLTLDFHDDWISVQRPAA